MMGTKVIQTEVPLNTYASFKKLAEDNKLSLRKALRKAVERWIEEEYDWSSDPVMLSKPVKGKIRTRAEVIDELLYRESR